MEAKIASDPLVPAVKPVIGVLATDELRLMGLRSILDDGEKCTIVSLVPPSQVDASRLDLAILDSTTEGDSLDVLATFRRLRPRLRVIVMGPQTDHEHIQRVIGAGAKGYLAHTSDEAELRMAISVVLDGSVWAPRKVLARLLESSLKERPAARSARVSFTPRELQVLQLLVMGQPNRQIALALGVDEAAVKAHMGRMMRKAGVDNRTALSVRAMEQDWLK